MMGGSALGPDGAGFDALGSKIRMSAQRIHRDATDDRDVERNDVIGDLCTIFARSSPKATSSVQCNLFSTCQ